MVAYIHTHTHKQCHFHNFHRSPRGITLPLKVLWVGTWWHTNKQTHTHTSTANPHTPQVTRGITLPLEVFRHKDKGWAVRCDVDIPIGGFVCAYIGELVLEKDEVGGLVLLGGLPKRVQVWIYFFSHIVQCSTVSCSTVSCSTVSCIDFDLTSCLLVCKNRKCSRPVFAMNCP
jgi:hypothetical protein